MKNLAILIGLFWCVGGVIGQEEPDTTKIKYKGKIITITTDTTYLENNDEEDEDAKHDFNVWRGLEFGFNGYFMDKEFGYNNDPDNIHMELDFGRSFLINLNVAEFNRGIIGENFRFVTGLGFRFNRYAFKNSSYRLKQNDTEVFATQDTTRAYYKNFLNTTYVTVPVYLSLVTGKKQSESFHLSAGIVAGARIGSRIKQRYVLDGKKEKEKFRNNYHLNPFTLDYSVRFGYGDFTAFANYSITQMFENNKGPEYYPFSFGVSLNF